jgi:hypothetical protein
MPTKRNRADSDLVRPRTHPPPPLPPQEAREPLQHYTTPIKAAVLSTVSFLDAHDIPYEKQQVFDHFRVSRRQGYLIFKDRNPRRIIEKETRGRLSKILKKNIK